MKASRTRFGFLLTFLIIVLGVCIIVFRNWVTTVLGLEPNEIGDYLAGVFAPIALVWIVLGYYQQSFELSQNTQILREQSEQAQLQTDALKDELILLSKQQQNQRESSFLTSLPFFYEQLSFLCLDISRADRKSVV